MTTDTEQKLTVEELDAIERDFQLTEIDTGDVVGGLPLLCAAARNGIKAEELLWTVDHPKTCGIHEGNECSCGLFAFLSPPLEPSGEREDWPDCPKCNGTGKLTPFGQAPTKSSCSRRSGGQREPTR